MRPSSLMTLLLISAISPAAEAPQIRVSLSARAGDSTPVLIQVAVPPGTEHRLQATAHLSFELSVPAVENGNVDTTIRLLDDTSGQPVELTRTEWRGPPTEDRSFAYTICSQRVILQHPIPSHPPNCADLPPMAAPDPVVGLPCGGCLGPYEGLPVTLSAVARIAPVGEPGEPMVITGRVFGPDGRPRPNVIVYAYHTNAAGIYPEPDPPRSLESNFQGRLRGWALTDARGRYTFETIRPARYPNSSNPQHVHMHVVERGCATYYIDEMVFADDPMLQRMSAENLARMSPGRGGRAITTPRRDASGAWRVTRDIYLGQNIPGYRQCARTAQSR